MSPVSISRSPEGLVRIEPATGSVPVGERVLLMFTVVLAAGGLALAGALPFQLVGVATACCVSAEVAIRLQQLSMLRRPAADVRQLRELGLLRRVR